MTVRLFRLIKLTVALAAVLLSVLLVRGWPVAGAGLGTTCDVLRAAGGSTASQATPHMALWPVVVRVVGWDIWGLGLVSAIAGLVGAWLVYLAVKQLFGWVVKKTKAAGAEGEVWYVLIPTYSGMITAYAYLASVLDGGPSPLAAFLILPALGLFVACAAFARRRAFGLWTLAAIVFALAAVELALNRRTLQPMAMGAFGRFLVLGLLPCAAMMNFTYLRKFVIHRLHRRIGLASWAAVVLAAGAFALKPSAGDRAAYEMASLIVRNAEGKAAIAADGTLSDLLAFMLPEGQRLIELARERDPAYGRELGEWVRGFGTQLPSANANLAKTDVATTARNTAPTPQSVFAKVDAKTNDATLAFSDSGVATEGSVVAGLENAKIAYRASDLRSNIEDLAFAAEMGPGALIDEWAKLDKKGLEATVATPAYYFPTREKWKEAVKAVREMDADAPLAKYFKRLVGVCGNALGCRALEEGDKDGAWCFFWDVMERVDRQNYAAVLNLLGMAERGFDGGKRAVELVERRRTELETTLKKPEQRIWAARSGGRIYVDPEALRKYEAAQRAEAEKRELSPKAQEFVKTVAAAPKDPKSGKAAQEAIYKAVREGEVRLDRIGGHLITIDLAIGDHEAAERDALAVLRANRHDPTANATLGSFAGKRGDYARAEQYLRRAIATGKASIGAKNDLAYVLMKLGRLDEAEPFAREAVKAFGEAWAIRETLAAILIRKGKAEEGERELQKAEELAKKAGIPKGKVVSLEIDRAWLLKAKGDAEHLKLAMRALKSRKDLTDEQRAEVKAMGEK